MLFVAVISRYGSALEGFFKGYIDKPGYTEMVDEIMLTGRHKNLQRQDGLFTTSYFHRVDELMDELNESGFSDVDILTIEGPWSCIPDFNQKWEDSNFRSKLMKTIEIMESDPSVIGLGGHIMAIARIR